MSASSDAVVTFSGGASYFCTEARDSPSLLRISEATFPKASSTWFLSEARASALPSDSPFEQLIAFRVSRYCVPTCAIVPSRTAAWGID